MDDAVSPHSITVQQLAELPRKMGPWTGHSSKKQTKKPKQKQNKKNPSQNPQNQPWREKRKRGGKYEGQFFFPRCFFQKFLALFKRLFFLLNWATGWLHEFQWRWPSRAPCLRVCFAGRGATTPSSNPFCWFQLRAAGAAFQTDRDLLSSFSLPPPFHTPKPHRSPQHTYWKEGHPLGCPLWCPELESAIQAVLPRLSSGIWFSPADGGCRFSSSLLLSGIETSEQWWSNQKISLTVSRHARKLR